jgi:hypothetical protein
VTSAKGAYIDKDHRPSEVEILAGLGSRRGLWEELNAFLEGNYRVSKDFSFYGKSYGWAVRFRKGAGPSSPYTLGWAPSRPRSSSARGSWWRHSRLGSGRGRGG